MEQKFKESDTVQDEEGPVIVEMDEDDNDDFGNEFALDDSSDEFEGFTEDDI